MNDEQRWQMVQDREDAGFVYAVATTGIYCRPTCPSRRPFRQNVTFFDAPAAAEAAGFRACKRCHPADDTPPEPHLNLVVQVCRFIEDAPEPPSLEALGAHFAMSPFHLQRVFKRIVGVSPFQYADAHRHGRLRTALQHTDQTVIRALYESGYGGRAPEMGMAPVHYRDGGDGLTITYALAPCPLGVLLVAATERGVCKVGLGDSEAALLEDLGAAFSSAASLTRDDAALGAWVRAIVAYVGGEPSALNLPLDIQATAFQRRVWAALRAVPYGETRTYSEIAAAIGRPETTRAVANACGANPVALVIPCHRVTRKDGALGGYRWGMDRKRALLEAERRG